VSYRETVGRFGILDRICVAVQRAVAAAEPSRARSPFGWQDKTLGQSVAAVFSGLLPVAHLFGYGSALQLLIDHPDSAIE
jgi:hypothetical protein